MATTTKKIYPASIYIVRSVYNTPKAAKVSYPNYDKMYVENESTTALNVVDNCFMFKSEECANITKDAVLYLNTTSTKGLYDTEFVLSYCNNDISKIDTPVMNDFTSLTQISSDDSVKSGVTLLPVPMSSSQALYDNRNNLPKGLYLTLRYAGSSDVLTVIYNDVYIQYTCTEPEICNFTVAGTSIDNGVTCTWSGEDIAAWQVQAKLNGSVVATQTGTTGTSCTFPVGTFNKPGTYTFELTATNNTSVTETATATLSCTQAAISLLELPGSTVNTDEAFAISWVSSNQTSFVLTVGDKTYTGTTQKSVTVPKNTVGKGTINVSLTVTYANQYYSNSATTSSSFVGYGKPSAPILNVSSSYSSAKPTLSWSNNEQTAYRVVIKQALTTIEDSNDTVSVNKYYTPTTALSNNTTYTISVKVKNKYNLWSDEATANFMIQFTVPTAPSIQAIADISTGSIIVTVSTTTTDDTEYKNTEIWKREASGEWKRMAYKLNASDIWQDFYVAGGIEYEYKARNIGKSGGISESSIITAQTIVNGYNFYDVENNSNYMRFTTGEAPKPKINQPNIVQNLFANASAPTTFGDGTLYWSCIMQFSLSNREETYKLFKLLQAKLLLYKDNKGHKWFGNIINSPEFSEDDVEIITVSLEFTQAQFEEEDVFCGDNLELIIWNGGWKFDGSHVFGGE